MGAVYEYLWEVFVNWWLIVTGILFGIDELLERTFPRYRAWLDRKFSGSTRRRIFLGAVFTIVSISGFLAWKDEHDKVEEKQAEINRQTEELRKASGSTQELEQLRREASGAKEEVQRLRNEVAALRKRAEGRRLSREEERELIRSLSALGSYGVIVGYESGDNEAHAFATSLVAMFQAIPGWKVSGPSHVIESGPRETGVLLFVSDQGEMPQAVAILRASFKREGIAFSLKKQPPTPQNHLGPHVFEIFVRSWS